MSVNPGQRWNPLTGSTESTPSTSQPWNPVNPISAGGIASQVTHVDAQGNRVISLDDDRYRHMDPAKALATAFSDTANQSFSNLEGFKLHKGFRPPGTNGPIELHTFSNSGGPDCYYLVRHWTVTYKDAQGQEQNLTFTKKIYTSVELPRDVRGHKQQQYIAALAARTYANVVESAMIRQAAPNAPNALFDKVGPHMSKIAKDRFVTLEMFEGGKPVDINPKASRFSNESPIKDRMVTVVRMSVRPGSKKENEATSDPTKPKEHLEDFYHDIELVSEKARKRFNDKAVEMYSHHYVLKDENTSSPLTHTMAALSQKDEILDHFSKHGDAKAACESVGANPRLFQAHQQDELNRKTEAFNDHARLFGHKKQVDSLMEQFGDSFTIRQETRDLLPPKTDKLFDKIKTFAKKEPPFAVLKSIATIADSETLTENQIEDLTKMVDAYEKAYNGMREQNNEIRALEDEMDTLQIKLKGSSQVNQEYLTTIQEHLKAAKTALAKTPLQFEDIPEEASLSESEGLQSSQEDMATRNVRKNPKSNKGYAPLGDSSEEGY